MVVLRCCFCHPCGTVRSLDEITPGLVLGGRYECLLPIARGGQASVWAARVTGARGFEKTVAIKTMLPSLSKNSNFERMFLDEARVASRISHPNVVEILDLGEEGALLYLVMEYVEGEQLQFVIDALHKRPAMPVHLGVKIVMDVCAGLHAAHELKQDGRPLDLVHRDVSPQNILVSVDGVPKVVDFGVAKANSLSGVRTATGTFKGKPAYMAPEQITGADVDRRADIFALGTVLYLITTGRHPFRAENDMATLHRVVEGKPSKNPSEHVTGYPTGLEFVVLKALSKHPEDRFQTAAEMARALMQAIPEVQTTGDTDVAACVRELGDKQLTERADALRGALAEADKRRPPAPDRGSSPTQMEPTHPDAPSLLRPSTVTPAPLENPTPPEAVLSAHPPRAAGNRYVPIVVGAVAIAAAFVIGAMLFGKRNNSAAVTADPSSTAATSAASTPSSTATPSAAPSASAAQSAEPADSAVSLDSLPKVSDVPDPARVVSGPRRDAGAPTPSATSPSKGYVPSIRDPGF